jgi:hypothetical protein
MDGFSLLALMYGDHWDIAIAIEPGMSASCHVTSKKYQGEKLARRLGCFCHRSVVVAAATMFPQTELKKLAPAFSLEAHRGRKANDPTRR